MAALTQDRNTPQAVGDLRSGGVAAATLIYAGAIVMRNASGYLTEGATAAAHVGVGRAEKRADNSGGAAGDVEVTYRPGVFRFANSAAADAIAIADIGSVCFIVDDQTVAKTDGTGTRSPAGFVDNVDSLGVWVRFDEAMLQAHLA
jgi:hypothetical protein